MRPEVFVVSITFVVASLYAVLSYLHAVADPKVSFKTIGYTLSGVSDSPERQLLGLLVTAVMAFVLAAVLYSANKTTLYPTSSCLGLFTVMLIFGTLLTRVSSNPGMHNMLAACTLFIMLLLMISMSIDILTSKKRLGWKRPITLVSTFVIILAYTLAVAVRITKADTDPLLLNPSTLFALLELLTTVSFGLLLYIFVQI